jgi:carbon storage regulator CsrA
MLVLSRKRDEKILLKTESEQIELTVVRIDANKVRLGINASDEVTILRSELVDSPKVTIE